MISDVFRRIAIDTTASVTPIQTMISDVFRRIASDTTAPVTPIQAMGLGMCRSSVKSEGRGQLKL